MQSLARRFYQPFVKIAMLANAAGTLVLFGLVAIMNIDVIARGVFHHPLRGVFEVVVFSLALIVYLQLPDVVANNRLTRSDGFLSLARIRLPRVGAFLGRAIDLLAGIFMAMIAYAYWPEAVESVETCRFIAGPEFGGGVEGGMLKQVIAGIGRCEYYGTPGIFTAPWFPVKVAIASSVSLCSIIFLLKAILGHDEPVSIEDVESPV